VEHLARLYGEKDAGAASHLSAAITRHVSALEDPDLILARLWTGHEWRQWMDANLPAWDGPDA
jgi:hypothetical protein